MPRLSETARHSVTQCYINGLIDPITEMIKTGIERGELRPVDPKLATWLLLGLLYPFFHIEQATVADNGTTLADLIITTFFDGLSQP